LRTVACATGVCAAFLVWASSCFAYSFGPTVTATGPEQTVFDWSAQACQQLDIPDEPARAFRDSTGRVQLLASHYITRRFIGPDLNSVQHSCSILLSSVRNAEPAAFNDKVWVASPYTRNGRTIYALLNDEYQGWTHPNMCDPSYSSSTPLRCWYNAITFASSKNNGNSYEIAPLSGRIVASLPYPYQSGPGPYGYFQPSNIVYNAADSYYYVMVASYAQYQDQAEGACLLRTKTPGNSASWLAWDGSAFSVSFVNPYASPGTPSTGHVCAPVAVDRIGTMTSSLTYNTYFGKYMLVGTETLYNPKTGKNVSGFFYSLSSDLITWGPARLLMTANFPWAYTCTKASEKPVYDPSVLDPNSTSRNFETTGQTMNLYYVRANFNGCSWGLDRDLVRIPIKFIVGGTAPTSSVARPSDVTPQSSTAPAPSAAAAPPGDSTATDSPPPNSDSPGG
jgi:hypothetical protein